MTEHDGTTGPEGWVPQQPPVGPPPAPRSPAWPPGADPAGPAGSQAPSWGGPPQQYPAGPYPSAGGPPQQYPTQQYPTTQYPTTQYPAGPYPGPGGPPQPDWLSSAAPPRRRRGRLTLAVAASVVAVLGVAGGAYAVLGDHSTTPDHYVPSDAVAVASLDLDSTSAQDIAAVRFLGSFPSLNARGRADTLIETLLGSTLTSEEDRKDFEQNFKPWLGARAAIAADPQDDKVRPVLVLEMTDRDKAQAGLARSVEQIGDMGFTLRDDYAIISESTGAANRAAEDSAKSSIADNTQYQHDTGTLDGDRIATGWADLGRAMRYVDVPAGLGGLPQVKGRAAFAVRFGAHHAEVEARVFGQGSQRVGVVGPDVTALPDGTAVAVGVAGLDKAVTRALAALDQAGLTATLTQLTAQAGLAFPDDITALLGDRAVLAANDDLSSIGLLTSADPDTAKRAADKLLAAIGDPNGVTAHQAGDHLVLASTPGYADQLTSGGHLGDQSLFRTAVPDAAGASVLVYVNLPQVLSATGEQAPPDAKAIRAVGVTVAAHGDTATLRIRIVVR